MTEPTNNPPHAVAVVIGATGTIGDALATHLEQSGANDRVLRLSRSSTPAIDLTNEASIEAAAEAAKATNLPVRMVIDATGFLHDDTQQPEKTWRHLDANKLARAFNVNAIGPALVMKHFLPLFPREGRSVFATLSARAGSLEENRIGGWYGYRASKAALNQLVRTAAAELQRKSKDAICVALHPGHVESQLSAPFGSGGNPTFAPEEAAAKLVHVLDHLTPMQTGGFFDHDGLAIPY